MCAFFSDVFTKKNSSKLFFSRQKRRSLSLSFIFTKRFIYILCEKEGSFSRQSVGVGVVDVVGFLL